MEQAKRPSAEVEAELKQAEARAKELPDLIAALQREYRALGLYDRTGRIAELRKELAASRRWEADAGKPRLRVRRSWGAGGDREHVLVKITPKRIYTREPGGADESQWNRDGTCIGYGSDHLVDVPEGKGGK